MVLRSDGTLCTCESRRKRQTLFQVLSLCCSFTNHWHKNESTDGGGNLVCYAWLQRSVTLQKSLTMLFDVIDRRPLWLTCLKGMKISKMFLWQPLNPYPPKFDVSFGHSIIGLSICLVILFIFCCFFSLSQSLMVPLCVHHLATRGKYGSVKCVNSCVALCAPVVCVWFRGRKPY